jgi:hypothetical protein
MTIRTKAITFVVDGMVFSFSRCYGFQDQRLLLPQLVDQLFKAKYKPKTHHNLGFDPLFNKTLFGVQNRYVSRLG